MRALDWSRTPLGPVDGWPQSLRTSVSICLNSAFPILVWWGPELVMLYNDAYRPMLGDKHPRSVGQPGLVCWAEIADVIGPVLRDVLQQGKASYFEDLMLPLVRKGFAEECYFTFTYSPIRDETSGVGGAFCAVIETTARVLGERRLATLRDLAACLGDATSAASAARTGAGVLEGRRDLPFALVYLTDAGGRGATLAGATSGAEGEPWAAPWLAFGASAPWPVEPVVASRQPQLVEGLRERGAPGGVDRALVLPVLRPGQEAPYGALVAGLSPMLPLDDEYRSFLALVAGSVAAGVANAIAHEEARRRAEALAQLDRAKTTFFSNVSHELRTPLALMLGPTEDALARGAMSAEEMRLLHRNELRLLQLVNALLEFVRSDAGRRQPIFEPTDLGAFTAELASAFRSAFERAALRLEVRAPRFEEPAWVSRDAWEKIVLNLLSNALKFTWQGGVELALDQAGDAWRLVVADTGVGIPPAELPRMFERFHRIEGQRSRSHEGSGIGLALAQDLARLHGGTIEVRSEEGVGSVFTVRIPRGRAHLPADQVRAEGALPAEVRGAAPWQVAAERWVPEPPTGGDRPAVEPPPAAARPRLLVADDNADMRAYLRRLLSEHWTVELASDGAAALEAARLRPPDLVLTDVMMPVLDGLGLLRALRSEPATRHLPVLMLSARAGEEERVDGLEEGADDYLVKPFSARELLARVRIHLELARARREAVLASRAKDEFLAMLGHELRNPLAPVLTAVQLLRLKHGDGLGRELTVIERQVRHLQALVDDLLDVERIVRGKLVVRREPVELAPVVSRAVELAAPLLEARQHELVVRVPAGLSVMGDADRLAQVFANLLTNAAKYTPPRGHLRIEAERQAETAEVRVEDDGMGIDPALLPRVFDLFVQEPRARDRAQGGLGIGLAVVKGLVELHGGSVSAESGPGRGSRFRVRLPAAAAGAAGVPPRGRPGLARAVRPLRILVVDDNEDAAMLLEEVLRDRGARDPARGRRAGGAGGGAGLRSRGGPPRPRAPGAGRLRGGAAAAPRAPGRQPGGPDGLRTAAGSRALAPGGVRPPRGEAGRRRRAAGAARSPRRGGASLSRGGRVPAARGGRLRPGRSR